jgi:hypothetical protein
MASLETISISYNGKDYTAAVIPDVFTSGDQSLLIGSHSLGVALYDDDRGYVGDTAREIDEQIYGFADDELFALRLEEFIERIKVLLD